MMEPSTSLRWWSTVGRVLVFVAVAVVAVVVIAQVVGIRLEVDGTGMLPMVSRFDEDAHFAALEADRAAQTEAAAALAAPDRRAAALWPAYRGAARDGRYDHGVRTDWPADGLPRLWHQPIGGGYASFAAADGRLFTIEQRRDREVVIAYDPETGRELWTHGWEAFFKEMMGGDGPRATPTWDDGRLFALGATGELHSLDAATGALRWRTNILTDAGATNLHWAMAASPLVVDNTVVVLPGGGDGRSVAAYGADTGEIVWTALSDVQAYTAPMLVELAGVRQILVVTAGRAAGLAVEDGTLLWDYPWVVSNVPNISQPLVLDRDKALSLSQLRARRRDGRNYQDRRRSLGEGALAHESDEEQVQQLGGARGAHLRARRVDSCLPRRRDRRARVEGRPLRLRSAAAGRRAPGGADRAG